jgi:hypothetical protein
LNQLYTGVPVTALLVWRGNKFREACRTIIFMKTMCAPKYFAQELFVRVYLILGSTEKAQS